MRTVSYQCILLLAVTLLFFQCESVEPIEPSSHHLSFISPTGVQIVPHKEKLIAFLESVYEDKYGKGTDFHLNEVTYYETTTESNAIVEFITSNGYKDKILLTVDLKPEVYTESFSGCAFHYTACVGGSCCTMNTTINGGLTSSCSCSQGGGGCYLVRGTFDPCQL